MIRKTVLIFTALIITALLQMVTPRLGNAQQETNAKVVVVESDTPSYPADAAESKVEGTVVVTVHINSHGWVVSEKYVSGPELLRKAAESSAQRWTFNRVKRRGIRTADLSFNFILYNPDGPAREQASATESPFAVEIIADPIAIDRAKGDNPGDEGDQVGVPECDEYLQKYRTCITLKMPKGARSYALDSLRSTVRAWREAAANPQTKAALGAACRQADIAAKAGMMAYGCAW
jgi:hypothetical protein